MSANRLKAVVVLVRANRLPRQGMLGNQLFGPVAEDVAACLADDQTEVLRGEPRTWSSGSRLILNT